MCELQDYLLDIQGIPNFRDHMAQSFIDSCIVAAKTTTIYGTKL